MSSSPKVGIINNKKFIGLTDKEQQFYSQDVESITTATFY
jgi:hypothetical protein